MHIVLTGVTRGLGKAWAERFRERGHIVSGCGRNGDQIAALATAFGPPHRFRVVDVARDAAVAAWAQEVLAALGPPELLINNAAVINQPAPLWRIPAAEFDRLIDVNIKGVANVIRHFVPAMVARRRGIIVNLSSGWGRSTAPEVAPYCASKFAIEGLTKALAQELPEGMAAVPLNPGVIDTEMLRQVWADGAERYPTPEVWSRVAADYVLGLGLADNGISRSVPRA
jgi:NAD(P)-dependent dehydrogenase (short-subunit alcohol dehydrogenase family)